MDVRTTLLHSGVPYNLSNVRLHNWIPHGHAVVCQQLHTWTCHWLEGHLYATPREPPFPIERVMRAAPSQCSGLDYLGPQSVKDPRGSVPVKVWIIIFTGLVTWSVHLECVYDITVLSNDWLIFFYFSYSLSSHSLRPLFLSSGEGTPVWASPSLSFVVSFFSPLCWECRDKARSVVPSLLSAGSVVMKHAVLYLSCHMSKLCIVQMYASCSKHLSVHAHAW